MSEKPLPTEEQAIEAAHWPCSCSDSAGVPDAEPCGLWRAIRIVAKAARLEALLAARNQCWDTKKCGVCRTLEDACIEAEADLRREVGDE